MCMVKGTANAHVFGERNNKRVYVWDVNVKQTRMCGKCVCFIFDESSDSTLAGPRGLFSSTCVYSACSFNTFPSSLTCYQIYVRYFSIYVFRTRNARASCLSRCHPFRTFCTHCKSCLNFRPSCIRASRC